MSLSLPSTISSGQLTGALRAVPVVVHNADGSTTRSNLFDQGEDVQNGRVALHVVARGATFGQPAAATPAAAPQTTTETSTDDGSVTVTVRLAGLF